MAGQKVKEGVSSLLGGLSKALTIEAEDLHKPLLPQYSDPPLFDRSKVSLLRRWPDCVPSCWNLSIPIIYKMTVNYPRSHKGSAKVVHLSMYVCLFAGVDLDGIPLSRAPQIFRRNTRFAGTVIRPSFCRDLGI